MNILTLRTCVLLYAGLHDHDLRLPPPGAVLLAGQTYVEYSHTPGNAQLVTHDHAAIYEVDSNSVLAL